MLKTAVVILNWNGIKFLKQFIPKLVAYSNTETGLFVIDNASTDDSNEFLRSNYPQISIIHNKENLGFAKGYNEGLKHIEAEYYCLLNSDVEVTPDWDKDIVEFMDKHPEVGVCQSKLLSFIHKDEFEYAGASGGYIDMLGYPFCRGRLFTTMEKDYHQYDDIAEVFWASGACMFVRKQIYHQLNGLDDDFFTHMEEIDFCWRVKSANYKVMCFPQSVVYHYGGGTLAMGSPKKTFYNFRNNLIMLYKNLPTNQLFRVFTLRFFLDVVAACRFLFDTGVKDFVAVFKAYVDFIWTIKKTHQKRKQITHQTKDLTKIYKRIIIIQYFLLKKTKFSDLNKEDFM